MLPDHSCCFSLGQYCFGCKVKFVEEEVPEAETQKQTGLHQMKKVLVSATWMCQFDGKTSKG